MSERRIQQDRRGRTARITRFYNSNRPLIWVCILIAFNQLGFGSIVPILPLYAESFGVSKAAIGLTIATGWWLAGRTARAWRGSTVGAPQGAPAE